MRASIKKETGEAAATRLYGERLKRRTIQFDPFRFPANIPPAFAHAVRRVVASIQGRLSSVEDWDVLHMTYPHWCDAYTQIELIYKENGNPATDMDMAWWNFQLSEGTLGVLNPRMYPRVRHLFANGGTLIFVVSLHDDIVEFVDSNGHSGQMDRVDWRNTIMDSIFLGSR